MGTTSRKTLNRRGIHDLTAAGWAPRAIAEFAGITERTVYRHLNELHQLHANIEVALADRAALADRLDPEGIRS